MNYVVRWAMNIEARNPKEAAKIALNIQRDPKSIATYFWVQGNKKTHFVDLKEEKGK